ncbi:MAG: hypothetical protein FJ137_02215 [Deltaproteobacteria bacterium]|nr:hypothetical protein [Deltaproteobacteria bacterium]
MASASDSTIGAPARAVVDTVTSGSPNIAWAATTPSTAPTVWANARPTATTTTMRPATTSSTVAAGFSDAPVSARAVRRAMRPAPVASVLHKSASAGLVGASRLAISAEPVTTASSVAVPRTSASSVRRSMGAACRAAPPGTRPATTTSW